MTEVTKFRLPHVLERDPCERCGTWVALVEYEVFDVPADEDSPPTKTPGPNETRWCEYQLWTHPGTGQQIARMFRPHSLDRCTAARTKRSGGPCCTTD